MQIIEIFNILNLIKNKLQHTFFPFRGKTPSVAELMYLDNARKLSLHGVEMHPALVVTLFLISIDGLLFCSEIITILKKFFLF